MKKLLFARLIKVDAAQRIVYGVAADEAVDKAKEVFDYDSSKPHFEQWSGEIAKATDGKSLGNVRAMHSKVAAGKVTDLEFDDDAKAIKVTAKIVDDDEWKKVEEGVYTGFSIGGSYVKRWKDGDVTRYTAAPAEISIVDNPCNPSASFTMVKADGSTEERDFAKPAAQSDAPYQPTAAEVAAKATELATAAGPVAKWTDFVEQATADLIAAHGSAAAGLPPAIEKTDAPADEPKPSNVSADGDWAQVWVSKRLPGQEFATKAELRAALAQADADDVAKKAAAPVLDALKNLDEALAGRGAPEPAAKSDSAASDKPAVVRKRYSDFVAAAGGKVEKAASLYSVANFLELLQRLQYAEEAAERGSYGYGDNDVALPKDLTDRFGAALVELGDIAAAMLDAVLASLKREEAEEALMRAAAPEGLAKAAPAIVPEVDTSGDLAKVTAERDALTKAFADLGPKINEVLERVKNIEAQPMPGGPARMQPVSKGQDGIDPVEAIKNMTPDQVATLLFKAAQQNPQQVIQAR